MSHVHQFVPVIETNQQVDVSAGRTVTQPISTLHPLLFGGGQLTAACIRGAQEGKCNSITASNRFEGLIPVIEDWHTKVVLLEVGILLAF